MNNNINIVRSNRKSIAIEIKRDCSILVRAPFLMSDSEIERFIHTKKDWICHQIDKIEARQAQLCDVKKLSDEELQQLRKLASNVIPIKVKQYASVMHVQYGRIAIRTHKTRWGSCSSKGNLNFNCLLMLAPDEVVDYVVIHELCHLLEMNHSPNFWIKVEQVMPNYKVHKKWLQDHGEEIMRKVF